MKRNLKTWLVIGASVIAAIAFASAAGILFSRPVGVEKGGDELTLKIMRLIIPPLCLLAIAFITMAISYFSVYEIGKGRNITPKDLLPENHKFLLQFNDRNKRWYAVVQDGRGDSWMPRIPQKPDGIKPGDFVRPHFLNGVWTLVPEDFYEEPKQKEMPEPKQEKTERPTKSTTSQKTRVSSIPSQETFKSQPPSPSSVKPDESDKKS